jgi:hypothetical protein
LARTRGPFRRLLTGVGLYGPWIGPRRRIRHGQGPRDSYVLPTAVSARDPSIAARTTDST